MSSSIINVGFYSLSPLPNSIRGTFELPAWPYARSEMDPDLVEYFKQYDIFYYRDSITVPGQFRAGLITPGYESIKMPVRCYSHSCYIDYGNRTFEIVEWWPQCSREFIQQCMTDFGDRYAWTNFNEPRELRGYNNRFIKTKALVSQQGKPITTPGDLR